MNRQTRTFIVLGVALVAAAIASFGVYVAISRAPVRQVAAPMGHAVVAATSLPVGTLLTADKVKLVDWPLSSPVKGGFDNVDSVVGRGLMASVVENEPLVDAKVAPREAGAGLPPSIPPGMRAMSVKVNEVIGVAGFVVPGTRVDVMVILRQKDDGFARVVVSNVQVLTAGTRFDQDNATTSKPIQSTVVTLLVSPDDAEKIALAQNDGQLMLSLRNPTDVAPTETRGVRTIALYGDPGPRPAQKSTDERPVRKPAKPAEVVAQVPPEVNKLYTVEAIRAAKRTEEPVR